VPDLASPGRGSRRLGLIGAGAIARAVAARVATGAVPGLALLGFHTRTPADDLPGPQLSTIDELLRSSVIVEAAGHEAVRAHAEAVLAAGVDFVCCSAGALADAAFRDRLARAAAASGARLIVPSGAVGGLDLLSAAVDAGLDEVLIEQRKPPRTVLSESEAAALDAPAVLFEGSVAAVVERYPQTTNVAAAVALAGIGFEATRARVVADPSLAANEAHLTARGDFGELSLRLTNVASANPRTSAVVAHSVVATLRRLSAPLVVPG
jgi:aspartate dehydrogenase